MSVSRDLSESEVWLVEEEVKSPLSRRDGFSVGIRNPGMKGE